MIAVIPAFAFQNLVPAGEGTRNPHGVESRLGTRRTIGNLLCAGDRIDQLFGERNTVLIERAKEMQAFWHRFLDSLDHGWMSMTENKRPRPADIIDIGPPAHVLETRSLALADDKAHIFRQRISAEPRSGQDARGQLVIGFVG